MNLIGLFLQPNTEAHVRMALRPMLGLMAECLYPANGKIKEADLRRMQLHLNAQMAGDLEKFLQETQVNSQAYCPVQQHWGLQSCKPLPPVWQVDCQALLQRCNS
jgi:hypothetical protein